MSDTLARALCDDIEFNELTQWLTINDITKLRDGLSQVEFARYLLEFLRKHTRLLLPIQDQTENDLYSSNPKISDFSNIVQSYNVTTETDDDILCSSRTSTPLKIETSAPINHKRTTSFSSKSSTPFNSSDSNISVDSHSETTKFCSTSIKLLERRLITKDPKPLQLGDFFVTREKQSKQKKKKRMALVSYNNGNETKSGTEKKTSIDLSGGISKVGSEIKIIEDMARQLDIKLNGVNTEANNRYVSSIKSTHKILIKRLALLYSTSITSNLIQDLLKELNYIISLLTTGSIMRDSTNYLCLCTETLIPQMFLPNTKEICLFRINIEGIYFASVVLENQWNLLKYLNKSTLSALSECWQLSACMPDFVDKIQNFLQENNTFCSRNVNILNREMLTQTVKFQMDNDCRPNYVNSELFYAFKKQRDEFYNLLHEWEDYCQRWLSTEFFKSHHKRMRQIFTISTASTNMHRLADLFVSQILASVFNEDVESGEKFNLSDIPITKFDLLNRRFVTPCSIVVGNEKRFPGIQEFFKDFLRASSENAFFFSHVKDVLIQRIVSLNNFKFSCEVSVALERQELFLMCINKLCLLAKFLSLVTFLPYQDQHDLPLHLRIPLAEARKEVSPPLDFDYYLTQSIENGRMVITIPWIIEFLNGIDGTSILLPCYKKLLAKLQYILYKIKLPTVNEFLDEIFLIYSEDVGKLLENAHIRLDNKNKISVRKIKNLAAQSDNDFCIRFARECIQTVNCSQILITLYVNSLFNNVSVFTIIQMEDISSLKKCQMLMSSEFYIGETALYQCCPQLYEIKSLLEGTKKLSYKSVTPKTEKTFCERDTNDVSVNVLMEIHFFDNMPRSVKKCVDFVAERISSQCVKSISQELIPKLKSKLGDELKRKIEINALDECIDSLLAIFYSTLKCGIKEELSKFSKNIETSLRALIEAEVSDESIIQICIDITCRKCIEIVYNWVFNYIHFNDLLKKEREIALEETERMKSTGGKSVDEKKSKKSKMDLKKNSFQNWISEKDLKNATWMYSVSPVKSLHSLRDVIRQAMNLIEDYDEMSFTEEYVLQVISDTIDSIEHRTDLQFIGFRRILMLSLEMVNTLVLYRPEVITDIVLEKFNQLWSYRKKCRLHLTFEQILSPHSMGVYWKLFHTDKTFRIQTAIIKFLVFTINNNVLHVSRLFSQILRLLRREWPVELLKAISNCLKCVLSKCNTEQENISFAIGWIADFIEDDLE